MNLKPILQIQGDKLDAYKKVRGVKAAKKNMLEAMKKDVEGRFSDYVTKGLLKLHVAYTTDEETARQWKEEVQSVFPDIAISRMDPLSFSVTCHTGPGVLQLRHHMYWMVLNNCRISFIIIFQENFQKAVERIQKAW